jgi:hypothetical protein
MVRVLFRWIVLGCIGLLLGISCAPQTDQVLRTSGIRPYYLRTVLPHTLTAYGTGSDTAEALREAYYHTRAQVIERVLKIHKVRMNDSLLTDAELQAHFRQYLLDTAEVAGWRGIQLLGLAIDSHLIRNRYFEYRRNSKEGRNYFFVALQMHWHDSLTQALSDHFYAYDRTLSDVIETATYYADKPADFDLIAFQMARLSGLPERLRDYRRTEADRLLAKYSSLVKQVHLQAVNITPSTADVMVMAGDRHLTGSQLILPNNACLQWKLLREDDGGYRLAYDESACPPASSYSSEIKVALPDGSHRSLVLEVPGNRVSMRLLGTVILHYFKESADGYAEFTVQSLSGQHYFIREIELNGVRLNVATNGLGRNIKGAGKYPIRVPITAESFKKLLKQKDNYASGSIYYTHPTSGVLTAFPFQGYGMVLKKHE